MKTYGTRELVAALTCLGYTKGKQIASRHLKYFPPNKIEKGTMPFILVMQNRKVFDPHWQRTYITQIKRHGFTKEQIKECFR